MKLSHKLVMVSAAALMSVAPLLGTAENVNTVQAAPKKTTSKKAASNKITLVRNAYVYDKNGKRLDKYMGSAKYTTIAKGVTVTSTGTKTINGVKYYDLGGGAYIKAVNVDGKAASSTSSLSKGTKAKFVSNSYIYDKNGKRISKYQGKSKFVKGDSVTTYGIQTINGKKYYQLDKKGTAFVRTVNIDGKTTSNQESSVSNDAESTKKYDYSLKKNAYIYDNNGKRINKYQGKSKLLKGAAIDVYGIETIKGKDYYQLDKKGTAFVKASNVTRTVKATSITMKKNAYIYNGNGDTKKKTVKKGKTVKATEARYIGTKLYYKISDNQFVKAANVGKISGPELEPVNEPDGAATVDTGDNTVDPNVTKVTTINVAPLYNIKGQPDNVRAFGEGQSQQVSELRYIATSATATPELFYKLSSGRGYLKDTDVAVSGKTLTPVNTPEQAREDVTVATAANKAKLLQDINEATSVKNSEAYKLASSDVKAAYDKAISDGTTVNNDATATIAQVNEADAAIVSAKAKLDGKRVAVANMTNLTSDEMAAIIKVVANANNVAESSVQLTTNGSLSISVNGAAQILNLGDYVTQAAVANN
ncbi:SLAP domain-containing protein [Lactobacillus crispatus]|uniref:Cell division protein n=1 Tax=Lactobacillus crispatus TaxID=47770 RepID=A0A226SCR4_9LACO|nr:SLAP domain-containing protein [Lactobacillus crispatus]MBW0436668.1 SLAP domain-containing protein [Lactobacillus crispatus]MBW0444192.1 SLAP domain-containing protein [Lactobacillus crispatus]MBW0456039.1 SLAP domain-containing protein [Lactobacillus crispatus]MDK7319909.1 SLAP domain-containing protein [Lactobacillus crispatus]MDK8272435.1 SLAP domain-containing protein [Lactobacillus crispatus]